MGENEDTELSTRQIPEILSPALSNALFQALVEMGGKVWLTGGWVRDFFLQQQSKDVDIVTDVAIVELSQRIVRHLGYGTIVPLGEDESCRLVINGEVLDMSSFRLGAKSIEQDLGLRDFTCNAMAFPLVQGAEGSAQVVLELIDPHQGLVDLENRVLRSLPNAFENDSLRILRAYRFRALYGFEITAHTKVMLLEALSALSGVAAERKGSELNAIISSEAGGSIIEEMDGDGVLSQLLPELVATKGLEQPSAHHLDVWGHSLAALKNMLSLVRGSKGFLQQKDAYWCDLPQVSKEEQLSLCWASLLHDIGKKECAAQHPKDGRPTFYHHDHVGAKMATSIARRLRWSRAMEKDVGRLIELHMYPFHLCSSQDVSRLSPKAALKLYRRAEGLLVPLFYMVLADSLASLGEGKPKDMEKQLQQLYSRVQEVYEQNIQPMDDGPRLVTGRDVMALCNLAPGPQVKEILKKIEELQVEGVLQSESDAVQWLKKHSLGLSKCS